jgi:hypothetical protein
MKPVRQPIRLRVKCAAALLALTDAEGRPLIPWEHAKQMTSEQIISLFQFDHYPIRSEAGGPSLPWNLVPRMIRAHRRKSAKVDAPEIAKIKRIQDGEAAFRSRLLAKDNGEPRPPSRWPKRKMRGR